MKRQLKGPPQTKESNESFSTDVLPQMQNTDERVKEAVSQAAKMDLPQMWKSQISENKKTEGVKGTKNRFDCLSRKGHLADKINVCWTCKCLR